MENKYYTPEIEEFHVGFEHEVEDLHDNLIDRCFRPIIADWTEMDLAMDDWEHDKENFSKNYRVKYLDKEDIESFGFKNTGRTVDDWYELKVTRPGIMTSHTNRRFVLQHGFRSNEGVAIHCYDYESGDSGENTIYRGSCKNKSELKQILKQIGVM